MIGLFIVVFGGWGIGRWWMKRRERQRSRAAAAAAAEVALDEGGTEGGEKERE